MYCIIKRRLFELISRKINKCICNTKKIKYYSSRTNSSSGIWDKWIFVLPVCRSKIRSKIRLSNKDNSTDFGESATPLEGIYIKSIIDV